VYRYTTAKLEDLYLPFRPKRATRAAAAAAKAGRFKLTHSFESAWFQVISYQVKTRFHFFLSNSTCTATPRASSPWRRRFSTPTVAATGGQRR
jgi:hypothetical protein